MPSVNVAARAITADGHPLRRLVTGQCGVWVTTLLNPFEWSERSMLQCRWQAYMASGIESCSGVISYPNPYR